jgi:FMN-dependent oxidoreductase (nitrilotriacetate monooxygenase family)
MSLVPAPRADLTGGNVRAKGYLLMILTAALMHGLGAEFGAWRVREGDVGDYLRSSFYTEVARLGEAGKLHGLFLAEQMTNKDTSTERPCGAMDTAIVLSNMASVTSKIGLIGTGSTTYNQPYELARRFGTLDHLTRGRTGWNAVTTANPATAEMFGGSGFDTHPEAAERYARGDEFIDVVGQLWTSWGEDAIVGDKEAGLFARPELVHPIDFVGKYFSVRGPLPFPRTPQGRPVIFHAGSSAIGRDQAARVADVVFTAQHTLDGAREFRADIRRRAADYGRDPAGIKILPGMAIVLGRTEDDAWAKKQALDDAVPLEEKLNRMARRTGLSADVLRDHLDQPFPVDLLVSDEEFKGGVGWRRSVVNLAVERQLTVRELLSAASSVHHHVVGTAALVADAMQERLDADVCDGFVIMVDVLPDGLRDVVELLVPELQARGLFHTDYEGDTLRASLGLAAAQPIPAVR